MVPVVPGLFRWHALLWLTLDMSPGMLFESLTAGGYILREQKMPQYVVPDLSGFKVLVWGVQDAAEGEGWPAFASHPVWWQRW